LFGEERIYDKLSPDAKAVLDKATELVELSMEMRQVMANDENHLNSWDAGYAQLKLVWKEYFPEQFKEFRQLYKNMEERMRPLVYDLGFLMK
jgi:TRAP-type mannitol/chloroaromatic compound transport system substrate-binding protein